jgi:aminoglycoside phosphotransferase (APT) family kinase protein
MERAQGVRVEWDRLPLRVRSAIEERLGGRVVEARNQAGGFSPGLAARTRTDDGTRVFLKALSPEQNPDSPKLYRREAMIAAALPPGAPVSRLLWMYDEGEGGWVALAFEDVEGHLPSLPWRRDELERIVVAIAEMHEALTPSPLALPPVGEEMAARMNGWKHLRGDEPGLDDWSRRHLHTLVRLEAEAPRAAAGETLIHFDLRADNILLTEDRVIIVDWPAAAVGAPWVDMIGMAPSVKLEGGSDPAVFFAMYPGAGVADPRGMDAVIATVAGYLTYRALQPAPLGLPTVRAFQAAQGEVARQWLSRRLNLA